MKIKKGFMLCPVMGKTMAIATGELEKTFSGMIKMNEPSVRIWKWIEDGVELEDIYTKYANHFGLDQESSKAEVDSVVKKMTEAGIFE